MRLEGKTALVTGGSRGIGRAIAVGLAGAGADVAISYTASAAAAAQVVDEARRLGRRAIAVQADAADRHAVERLVDSAWTAFGRIDCLVNNASIILRAPLLELRPEDLERVFKVNVVGYLLTSQAVVRRMLASGRNGSIINVSSAYQRVAAPGQTAYCVSKGAVAMLTKQMALELGRDGIRVNSICPGVIQTDMNRDALSDAEYRQKRLNRIPLGRLGEPGDLVGAAIFLASDECGYLTGAELFVDGGEFIW